jgi:peptidoglycan/LPS O-acetylase OafA/YrhL
LLLLGLIAVRRRFTRAGNLGSPETPLPVKAIALRSFGVVWLLICVIGTFATPPHPGLHGRSAVILVALNALIAAAVGAQPERAERPPRVLLNPF